MDPVGFRLMTETNYTNERSLELLTAMIHRGMTRFPTTTVTDWINLITNPMSGELSLAWMNRVKEGVADQNEAIDECLNGVRFRRIGS